MGKKNKGGRGKPRDSGLGRAPDRLPQPKAPIEAAGPYRYRVRRNGAMRTAGLIFANDKIIEGLERDKGAQQVANVATLPGIVGSALAMPDIHWGYGFPIGGVAAFDSSDGVVSPGGIGYDINCGVRLIATSLLADDIHADLVPVTDALLRAIPSGVGSRRKDIRLDAKGVARVLNKGAAAAVAMGFGEAKDLDCIEDRGAIDGANPDAVSKKSVQRGAPQIGTLGSGNHFVELGRVAEVLDTQVATSFGLFAGQLTILIHTGSRGLGHQVATEAVQTFGAEAKKAGIALPDRQLSCAPLSSKAAERYLGAMAAAANFAFANRQIIGHTAVTTLEQILGVSEGSHKARVVYDVAHNIAKWEDHQVDGRKARLLVHRKGATRALGPGHPQVPESYRQWGQPVLIPGDMGRASYVLVGTKEASDHSFASACHGAGRLLSRSEALKRGRGRSIDAELKNRGVIVRAASRRTLVEEMPEAYKDVSDVVDVVCGAGLCCAVARLEPLAVVKG